jgi:O-antigen/teichoic acid export membrane protein
VSGVFFLGLQQRFNDALLLVKRTRVVMVSLLIAGVINIGLNGWLLPIFGYQIAAVTTLVSYLILCGLLAVASRHHLHWPFPWATAMRSLVAAGVMGSGLIVLLRQTALSPLGTLGLGVPIGIILYGVTIWACGEMAPAERQYVISMIRSGLNLSPKGRKLHPGG